MQTHVVCLQNTCNKSVLRALDVTTCQSLRASGRDSGNVDTQSLRASGHDSGNVDAQRCGLL